MKSDNKYKLSLAALKSLNDYDWQGNVRELESVIKRAKVFCESENRGLIQPNDLPSEIVKSVKLNFEDLSNPIIKKIKSFLIPQLTKVQENSVMLVELWLLKTSGDYH